MLPLEEKTQHEIQARLLRNEENKSEKEKTL